MTKKHFYLFLLGALLSSSLCASETKPEEELQNFQKCLKEKPNLALMQAPAYPSMRAPYLLKLPKNIKGFKTRESCYKDSFNNDGVLIARKLVFREVYYGTHLVSLLRVNLYIKKTILHKMDIKKTLSILVLLRSIFYDQELSKSLPQTFLANANHLYQELLKEYTIQYQKYPLQKVIKYDRINDIVTMTILKQEKMQDLLFPPSWNDFYCPKVIQQIIGSYIASDIHSFDIPSSHIDLYISFLERDTSLTPENLGLALENDIRKRQIQETLFAISFKRIVQKKHDKTNPLFPSRFLKVHLKDCFKELQPVRDQVIQEQLPLRLLDQGKLTLLFPKSWGKLSSDINIDVQHIILDYLPPFEDNISKIYLNTYISLLEQDSNLNIKSVDQVMKALNPKLLKEKATKSLNLAIKNFCQSITSLVALLIKTKIVKGEDDECYPLTIKETPQIAESILTFNDFKIPQYVSIPQSTSVNPTSTLKD